MLAILRLVAVLCCEPDTSDENHFLKKQSGKLSETISVKHWF